MEVRDLWDNILKEPILSNSQLWDDPASWDVSASWDVAKSEVNCYTTSCLICHRARQLSHRQAVWNNFICPECRYKMLRDGIFIIESLHNIVQDLSRKRYQEEDFFIRLDHTLKTLKIDHIIVNYKFNFSQYINYKEPSFYIELELNPPTRDLRMIGIPDSSRSDPATFREKVPTSALRTYSFSVEACCIPVQPPERTKREYLSKEHFKWEC